MELSQLKILKAVVENQTMTAAAKALHMTQPALSTSIRKLEEELGTPLFTRINNRMALNDVGIIAYRHACSILDSITIMNRDIQAYLNKQNTIRILFDDPGPMWYLIPNLQMAYGPEEIQGELTNNTDLINQLLAQEASFLISSHPITDQRIHCEELIEESLLLSVPEDSVYATYESIDLLKECPESIIRYSVQGEHEKVNHAFWNHFSNHCNIRTYADYFLFSQALKNKDAITLTTRIVQHYRDDGNHRVLIPITTPGTKSMYYLSWLNSQEEYLQDYIRSIHFLFNKI